MNPRFSGPSFAVICLGGVLLMFLLTMLILEMEVLVQVRLLCCGGMGHRVVCARAVTWCGVVGHRVVCVCGSWCACGDILM